MGRNPLVPCPVPPVHQLSSWVGLCQSIQLLPPTHLQWLITEGFVRMLSFPRQTEVICIKSNSWEVFHRSPHIYGCVKWQIHGCEIAGCYCKGVLLSTLPMYLELFHGLQDLHFRVSWLAKGNILLNKCQKSEVKWIYHFFSVWESSPHSLNTFICHVIAVAGLIGLEPKSWPNSEGVRNPHFSARHEKLEPFNPHRKINDKKNSSIRQNSHEFKSLVEFMLFLLS